MQFNTSLFSNLYLTIETRSGILGERAVNKGENSNPVDFEEIQNHQTKWGEKNQNKRNKKNRRKKNQSRT
jgi:hypothetical protein